MIEAQNPYTWSTLFQALLALGEVELAIRCGYAARDRFPWDEVILTSLANGLKDHRRKGEAETLYRFVLATAPASSPALCGLAEISRDRGDLTGSRNLYERALDMDSKDSFALIGLAGLDVATGSLESAALRYKAAAEVAREKELPTMLLVRTLGLLGRDAEALSIAHTFVRRYPNSPRLRASLAEREAALADAIDTSNESGSVSEETVSLPEWDMRGSVSDPVGEHDADSSVEGRATDRQLAVGGDDDAAVPDWRTLLRYSLAELQSDAIRLRADAARTRSLPEGERLDGARDVLRDVDDVLRRAPRDAVALFTRVEVALQCGEVARAERLVSELPHYMRDRTDFLSLRALIEQARASLEESDMSGARGTHVAEARRLWSLVSEARPELAVAAEIAEIAMGAHAQRDASPTGRVRSPGDVDGPFEEADVYLWAASATDHLLVDRKNSVDSADARGLHAGPFTQSLLALQLEVVAVSRYDFALAA